MLGDENKAVNKTAGSLSSQDLQSQVLEGK